MAYFGVAYLDRSSSQRMWLQPLWVMIAPLNGTLTLLLAAPGRMFWEEECCSNLIMNLREANDDRLQPAVLDGRMLLGCLSGLPGVLKRNRGGILCILPGRCSSTQKECEHQRLGSKIWSVPQVNCIWTWKIMRLDGKVRTRAIPCHGAIYTCFPGTVVNSTPFSLPEMSWFVQ